MTTTISKTGRTMTKYDNILDKWMNCNKWKYSSPFSVRNEEGTFWCFNLGDEKKVYKVSDKDPIKEGVPGWIVSYMEDYEL